MKRASLDTHAPEMNIGPLGKGPRRLLYWSEQAEGTVSSIEAGGKKSLDSTHWRDIEAIGNTAIRACVVVAAPVSFWASLC